MQRTLTIFKIAALGCATLLAISGCLLLLQTSSMVHHADVALASSASRLNADLDEMHTTMLGVNKLVNDSRYTLTEVNRNVLDERKMYEQSFPAMVARVDAVLGNVQTATADLHPLLQESTARIHGLEPIEANSADLIVGVTKMVADPRIPSAIAHLDDASAHLAAAGAQLEQAGKTGNSVLTHVDHIAADGEHVVHSYVYPKPIVSIVNWTLKGVHALGGWLK